MDFFYCVALSHGFLFLQAPSAAGVSARGKDNFFSVSGGYPIRTSLEHGLRKFFSVSGGLLGGKSSNALRKPRTPHDIGLRLANAFWTLYMTNAIMLRPANTSKKIYNPRRKRRREKISRKDRKIPQSSRMRRRRYIFHQRRKFRQQPAK